MSSGLRILHLEDDAQSAEGLGAQSDLIGVDVDQFDNVQSASEAISTKAYAILVIDLEVFDNGKRHMSAGSDLVHAIRDGSLGPAADGAHIIVHTANLQEFHDSGLAKWDRVDLVRKPSSALGAIRSLLAPATPDRVVIEVTPMAEDPSTGPFLEGRVLGWGGNPVLIPMASLDPEGLMAVSLATEPIYFSALANLHARSESELGLVMQDLVMESGQEVRDLWAD